MKETKLHHQQKFLALGLAISKILCNFTSLKHYLLNKRADSVGITHRLSLGIVPPYRSCNSAMPLSAKSSVLAMGKAMPFLFAKVKSQPFNGFIV